MLNLSDTKACQFYLSLHKVLRSLQVVLSPFCNTKGGKSGQHRASHFLTGRRQCGNNLVTESATENIPPRGNTRGKGENAR